MMTDLKDEDDDAPIVPHASHRFPTAEEREANPFAEGCSGCACFPTDEEAAAPCDPGEPFWTPARLASLRAEQTLRTKLLGTMAARVAAGTWSPDAARAAVQAAITRYRSDSTRHRPHSGLEAHALELLADDRAFDTPEALTLATWIYVPHEVRAVLDAYCRANGLGEDHHTGLRMKLGRERGWL